MILALSASPYALRSLQELIDVSRILFGSDYPFAPKVVTAETASGIQSYDGFRADKLSAIELDSALRLFP